MFRNILKVLAVIIVAALFVFVVIYAKNFISEKTSSIQTGTATEAYQRLNKVSVGGVDALPKEGIKTLLIVGLDIDGEIKSSDSYNNAYNADFLLLVTFDMNKQTCQLVEVNRDSIVPVQRLDIFGQKIDQIPMQICLSYSYGDGLGVSARNTKTAVSNMFYGLNIDYYMVISRDATRLAVDYVGGIDVTMDENYTDIDPTYVKGTTHHLNSSAAMEFVSARQGTLLGTNTYRMQRQICLINSLIESLQKSDCNFSELYNSFVDYTLTDVDFAMFSRWLSNIAEYDVASVITPTGSSEERYGHNEFYIDEDSIKEIALDVFYDRI